MRTLNFTAFMKKENLKNATMNEYELQRLCKNHIYTKNSKTNSNKGFVSIDNGSMGGTHWSCFLIKDNKSYYFHSFGGQPDEFLHNQLPKPIDYRNYKIQDISSSLCGSYCSCFFYLIERKN